MRFTHRLVMLAALAAVVFVAGSTLGAQDSRQAKAQLKAAQQLEEVAGNLPAAIEAYRKLSTNPDRVVAAEALLRMAGCQEKLGQADARKTYQEVIARFPEQTAVVAEAKGRMGAGAVGPQTSPAGKRLLWTLKSGDWVTGPLSPDARLVAYATQISGGYVLAIHDLQTGTDRVVAQGKPGESDFIALSSAFSRDGQKLAYRVGFSAGSRDLLQLRVIDLSGSAAQNPQPRVLLESLRPNTGASPFDWTPDGKWIAVQHQKDAITWEYGLVSSTDGSLRVLKTVKFGRRPGGGYLSPDGRLFAAEVPEDASGASNIVVLPLDGSPEIPIVDFKGQDTLMGWTTDGRSVLFTSERVGANALWSQRIENGRLQGQVELLVPNFGPPALPLLVTSGGALYARSLDRDESSVMEAAFDFATGTFVTAPRDVAEKFVRSNGSPRWSPDGKRLAYVSDRVVAGETPIRVPVIRTWETGESREVPIHFSYQYWAWDWLPDSQAIAMVGYPTAADPNSGRGVYRIDVDSGFASPIVLANAWGRPLRSADGATLFYTRPTTRPMAPGQQPWLVVARDLSSGAEHEIPSPDFVEDWKPVRRSRDGRKEYEGRLTSNGTTIIERDLSVGTERELVRLFGDVSWDITADGRSIAATTVDTNTNEGVIVLCSLTDGSIQALFRGARGQQLAIGAWAADKGSALVRSRRPLGGQGVDTFWWVPFDGRQAKPLLELTNSEVMGRFELHPDGRRLAFEVRLRKKSGEQLWVLENFLPVAKR